MGYSNPNISGVGKLLIEEIINYGFKEIDIKEINNQKVICMELVNENW